MKSFAQQRRRALQESPRATAVERRFVVPAPVATLQSVRLGRRARTPRPAPTQIVSCWSAPRRPDVPGPANAARAPEATTPPDRLPGSAWRVAGRRRRRRFPPPAIRKPARQSPRARRWGSSHRHESAPPARRAVRLPAPCLARPPPGARDCWPARFPRETSAARRTPRRWRPPSGWRLSRPPGLPGRAPGAMPRSSAGPASGESQLEADRTEQWMTHCGRQVRNVSASAPESLLSKGTVAKWEHSTACRLCTPSTSASVGQCQRQVGSQRIVDSRNQQSLHFRPPCLKRDGVVFPRDAITCTRCGGGRIVAETAVAHQDVFVSPGGPFASRVRSCLDVARR